MMIKVELKKSLLVASEYFLQRGILEWANEASEAISKIENNDYSFVENLWLKYAPTCDIDDLIITIYEPEDEAKVNELNQGLADIANRTFALLDKYKNEHII